MYTELVIYNWKDVKSEALIVYDGYADMYQNVAVCGKVIDTKLLFNWQTTTKLRTDYLSMKRTRIYTRSTYLFRSLLICTKLDAFLMLILIWNIIFCTSLLDNCILWRIRFNLKGNEYLS